MDLFVAFTLNPLLLQMHIQPSMCCFYLKKWYPQSVALGKWLRLSYTLIPLLYPAPNALHIPSKCCFNPKSVAFKSENTGRYPAKWLIINKYFGVVHRTPHLLF